MSDCTSLIRRLVAAGCLAALCFVAVGQTAYAFQDPAPAPALAAAAPGETATAPSTAPPDSFLGYLLQANGWLFGPVFLAMSFILVALILVNIMEVRRDKILPAAFIEDFETRLNGKDYQGAYESAKSNDSFVARVLHAGLNRLPRGYSEAVEGMQEVGEDENMVVEHRLGYLALIGSIAPMVGLLGTVWGMVASFQTIARSTTSPKPAELASGISMALVTTLEGLLIAIPAMIVYGLLRNRAARYSLEVGMISEGLMQRFSTAGRKTAGGAAPSAAPAKPEV